MITIYNSNLDFDLTSSNSITLSSTSNMVFKTNGSDKLTIQNNGISVSGNVVVSGLITSTGGGFSGIGANLTNIPISAINELRLELNGSTTDLSVTRDALTSRIVSEVGFGSNYTGRINSELNTRVDNTCNYVLATSNILIGRIINTSNYVDSTSNFLSGRIDNTSNYALATSNILIGRIINTSNYVDSTSNTLIGRIINTSNYVESTSNILIGRIINTSNYVESTSNTLIGRIINTSNYVESTSNTLIGRIINTSNYVESTSNTLIGRIINTSNYVSSYKPLTAVRADTADKFTTSRKIANVPFDGSSDINISYNNLENKLNAATGIDIDISNNISAVYASTNLIGIFNTTDFANVNSKIELTKNTSNYVDRINTSLTTAIALGDKWATSNASIYYNTSNVGIGTFNPVGNLHIYNDINTPKLIIQDGKIAGIPLSIIPDGTTGTTTTTIGTTEKCTIFTNTGATQSAYTFTTTNAMLCDILIVAGGGGGGSRHSGGGGAGAVIYLTNQTLSIGTYSISVGLGGIGNLNAGAGTKGNDSSVSFNSTNIYLAKGGGAGGTGDASSVVDGGSGGGNFNFYGNAVTTNIPEGFFGNSGGLMTQGAEGGYGGGGGGGAGGTGANSVLNGSGLATAGKGGDGRLLSINGTATYYGGGGGGGVSILGVAAGDGGLGGGGSGSKGNTTATSGTDGRGGGGGGGGFSSAGNGAGGNGGSGVVIIRYKLLNLKPEIQFIIGKSISSGYNNYKIGNYNGEFQVKSSISEIDATAITIINNGNVAIGIADTSTYKLNVGGSLNATSLFVGGSAFTRDMTSNYSDRVGVWSSNYTDRVGVWGSNYTDRVGVWSSNYSDRVGVWSSNYTDRVGVWGSNYTDRVGVWGSNYTDRVGGWGSNYAYDKVGVWSSNYTDRVGAWGSNYTDRIGERSSNYVLATSNILIGRIINTSNYVSSYKPLTAVTADFANRFTNSVNIAGVPFNGTANISISYNSLDNQLSFGNGLSTSYDNFTKITSVTANAAPQEQSDWTQTSTSLASFIKNKPDLTIITTNNTNTSNYVDRINTSLTTAIGLKQDVLTSANTIGVFNTTTDFVVNGSKIELTKNTSNYVLATSNLLVNYNNLINKPSIPTNTFQLNGTNIFYNSGNVGIGINAPLSLMEIITANYTGALLTLDAGVVNSTTQMPRNIGRPLLKLGKTSVSATAGDYYGIGFGISPTLSDFNCAEIGTIITSKSGFETGDIIFSTRPNTNNEIALERMRITSAGNVGIGVTDTSTYKLNVGGDINISTGSSFRVGGNVLSTFTPSSANLIGSFLNTQFEDVSSSIRIKSSWKPTTAGAADTATALVAGSAISANTITASGLITANAGISIPAGQTLTSSGNISANTMTTSGLITANTITASGNVGIGTNTGINNIFQIGSGARLRIANNSSGFTMIGTNDTDGTTNTKIVISGNDRTSFNGNINYITTSTGSHIFSSGGGATERMRITSDGNVGIGTEPTSELHIFDKAVSETKLTIQNNFIPTAIEVTGTTGNLIGTTDRFISFPYSASAYTFTTTNAMVCDILIVAGGGGGGSRHSGGGGAGAVIYLTNQKLSIGSYSIRVGNGGTGGAGGASSSSGTKGGDSSVSFNSTTIYLAKGGGAGATDATSISDGGSGGGNFTNRGKAVSTTNIPEGFFGSNGGLMSQGTEGGYGGGGGGGAGESGADSVLNGSGLANAGKGGDGRLLSINGTATYYGGGGGGGVSILGVAAGDGGLGGGGSGSKGNTTATSGTDGRGGGGGGGGFSSAGNGAGGNGGSGVVIIRYRSVSSSIQLIRGTEGDSNIDYKIGNYDGDFKIISSENNVDTEYFKIKNTNVDINGNIYINGPIYNNINARTGVLNFSGGGAKGIIYFGAGYWHSTNTYAQIEFSDVGSSSPSTTYVRHSGYAYSKFDSNIQVAGVNVNSDSRIKKNITDINDDKALQLLLRIEPKTYDYLDIEKGTSNVYGFIAQQIREIIPEATTILSDIIPNILEYGTYSSNIITFPNNSNIILYDGDFIRIDCNERKGNYCEILKVHSINSFEIKNIDIDIPIEAEVYIYGTMVKDFHTIDKNYIYTLNVCATQELHRRIEAQNDRIKELEAKIDRLLNS